MSIDKVHEEKLIDILYNLVLEGTDGYYKNTKYHLIEDNNSYIELLDFISQAEARGKESVAEMVTKKIDYAMLNIDNPTVIRGILSDLLTKLGGKNEYR